jgi:2-polyprenyl-3-methyl-5-hydroxy-6-metoxy-1,4-benzoquinol methylase
VSTQQPDDLETLNRSVQRVWNQNAQFWSDAVGEGNAFQRLLIGPATERLLEIQPGELVLDIACGNGHFARRLARLGAQVVAIDFSERFLETAKARTQEHADCIEERVFPKGFEKPRVLNWESFHEIPPILVVRLHPVPSVRP